MTFSSPTIPLVGAVSLCATIEAIRAETAAAHQMGVLSVDADELLAAAGASLGWLAALRASADVADDLAVSAAGVPEVALPDVADWELGGVVYGISAVLVWADDLRREGLLSTDLPASALAAWDVVEGLAGQPGRTAAVLALAPSDERVVVLPAEQVRPRPATGQVTRWATVAAQAGTSSATSAVTASSLATRSTAAATAGATSALKTLGMM
ncbi:hypothetical protein [Euzebya sp.]|uniref:hypothetical protein n=1 Tax=Euzebya sp. TaxID=1971409 RepID=UPI0035128B8E